MATVEYLLVLGLVVGAVIAALTFTGNEMGSAWLAWANWFSSDVTPE